MRLSLTLSSYIGRQFAIGLGVVFLILLGITLLFDVVELMRRAASHPSVSLGLGFEMALLRLPHLGQKIVPFAALFGTMIVYARLTRTHELVVARAAGVSVWQFLLPAVLVALAVGVATVTVVNPLSSALVQRYERLEARHLGGRSSLLAVFPSGLWLREGDNREQTVIHAARVTDQGGGLEDATFFVFGGEDRFVRRLDARWARLAPGEWQLIDVLITAPDQPAEFRPEGRLPTTLTSERIQDSFASPETMSFWALPTFIATLEAAGFSALKHRLYWHAVVARPLLLCAMVLVAATFSLRLTRRGGTGLLILVGVVAGFLLYFLSDVTLALGLSGSLPPALAAWAPAVVSTLLGLAMLLHIEGG